MLETITDVYIPEGTKFSPYKVREPEVPSNEDNNTLLKAFPTVKPNPGSRGLNSNLPEKSVDSIIITLSGF